jgi:hypothetical protein
MKSISCWDDLSAYGIIPLTGEACGLSYRILCDVTAQGKSTLEQALSVAQLRLHEYWNCGDLNEGSVMLAPDLLPFIGIFARLEAGCREVWLTKGHTVIGIEADALPGHVESFQRVHANDLTRRFVYRGCAVEMKSCRFFRYVASEEVKNTGDLRSGRVETAM